MFHEYPYSTYYSDVDEICRMCRDLGIRLEVKNDYLRLIDKKGNVLSNVQISWAEKARYDEEGHLITSYVINVGADAHKLVINHGDGSVSTVTVPYAEESQTALDCIVELSSIPEGLHYRLGNGDVGTVVPGYSVKAEKSSKGRDIDSFAVSLEQNGAAIDLKDNYGAVLASLIPAYAKQALEDADGDIIDDTYGTQIRTGVKTIKLVSKDGEVLSEITVPWADSAKYDEDGNEIDTFYGHSISSVNGNMQLKDAHGTVLSTAEIQDFGAITQVSIVGDQLVFTNRAGQTIAVTVPYAVKCQKDSLGNTIVNTYIASVQNDSQTGALNFYDATGTLVCTLTPTVTQASQDDYGNTIADYIKSIVVDNQSDYVIATHGDGTTDTLTINYSNVAWKDTNGNVIKNTYTKRVEFIEDPNDHHMKLVGYNGDNPEAEIWRTDMLVDLSNLPYGNSLDLDGDDLSLLDRNEELLSKVTLPYGHSLDLDENSLSLLDASGNTLSTVNINEYINLPECLLTRVPNSTINYNELRVFSAYNQKPYPFGTVNPIVTGNDELSITAGNHYWFEIQGNASGSPIPLTTKGQTYIDENDNVEVITGDEIFINPMTAFGTKMRYKYPTYNEILGTSYLGDEFKVIGGYAIVANIPQGTRPLLLNYYNFRLIVEVVALETKVISHMRDGITVEQLHASFNQYANQMDYVH